MDGQPRHAAACRTVKPVAESVATVSAPPAKNLDKSIVHGVAWTAGVQWLTQLLSWGVQPIMMATLGPANYGIVAMATVFTAFIEMASDFGMAQAVVKHRELTDRQIAMINGLCVLMGLTGWAICCAAAYPILLFYGVPALTTIVIVMSASFLITSFRSIPLALMERDLDFRTIAGNQAIQGTVLPLAMITFAVVLKLEYWSLVCGSLLAATMTAVLARRVRPTPFAWPRFSELRGVLSFGSHMIAMRFSYYLTTCSDVMIGGWRFGQVAVGSYSQAMYIAGMPSEKISGLAMRVMPPIISAVQNDLKQLRRYILSFTEIVSLLTVPAGIGLALVASDMIHWLLPKWTAAIIPLQILAIACIQRSTLPIIPSTAAMIGLSRTSMRISVWASVLMPIVFIVGSFWGVAGLATGWLVVYPIFCVPYYVIVFRKIEMPVGTFLRSLWPSVSSAALMAIAVLAAHQLVYANAVIWVRVIADCAIGGIVYGAALLGFHRHRLMALKDIYRMVRS